MILFFIRLTGLQFLQKFQAIALSSKENLKRTLKPIWWMTYHLWCSSNSYVDDSIRLHLFQRTLIGAAAKWYTELPRGTYVDYNSLAMTFVTNFQLSVHYENATHLLTSLKQYTATHISDHIHEQRHRRRLIKFKIPNEFLTEWFTKSFINKVVVDISMGGCVTKDQDISRAQYLDLVYSQSGMLYDMFSDALRPSLDLSSSKSPNVPPIDGVIRSVSQTSTKASSTQKYTSNTGSNHPSKNPSNPSKTSKVHAIQSTTEDKASKGNKNRKGKEKYDTPKQDPLNSSADDASKRKLKYPCLICEEDHYTKDCPRHTKVSPFEGTPVVLKEPFPSHQTQLVDQPQSYASSGSQVFMMQGSFPIFVAT